MDEFSIIEKYFAPLTMGQEGAGGLKDDGAVLDVPEGCELVLSSDTLNEGVHFLSGEAPDLLARKALRVNLSDLASMGAKPYCYQLCLAFPEKPQEFWLEEFCKGLLEDNRNFGVFCSGGDTTSIKGDGLSIGITALGFVPRGKAVRRAGAKDGDYIVLSGCVGDAALGLKVLQGQDGDLDCYAGAVARHRLPQPRVGSEDILQEYVNAAADVSDGLLADCMNIARASGLGAEIDFSLLEFSNFVRIAIDEKIISLEEVVSGGDDYELIMAVSEEKLTYLLSELGKIKLNPVVIGRFKDNGLKIEVKSNGKSRIYSEMLGWRHF